MIRIVPPLLFLVACGDDAASVKEAGPSTVTLAAVAGNPTAFEGKTVEFEAIWREFLLDEGEFKVGFQAAGSEHRLELRVSPDADRSIKALLEDLADGERVHVRARIGGPLTALGDLISIRRLN